MVVKSKRGRRRYIVFSVSENITRGALIREFSHMGTDAPYIVQCIPGMAVLRCSPERREETVSLMSSADPPSSPLRTSGTLRTLRDEFPDLKAAHKAQPKARMPL
ncbi:MAG: hypothetical protein LBU30_03440 [Candidatus Methanoplasma sp.]|jgi:RNase P/RNase MRP subunit POP5|nr:hypothetical protein [Candidatus Methanoplasma sp.]